MVKVKTLDEAMNWFLANSSGSLICERDDGEEKECSSFPEAKRYYNKE